MGEFVVDFRQLPDPIFPYAHHKHAHIYRMLNLRVLSLCEELGGFLPSARATKGRGRAVAKNYHINTVIYTVRYLQTVDAAAARVEADEWALPMRADGTHLPLLGNHHFTGVKPNLGVPQKTHVFKAVKRAGAVLKLAVSCGCLDLGLLLTDQQVSFYQACGKFYRSNVQLLVDRIGQEEPHAKMGPFKFTLVQGERALDGEEQSPEDDEYEQELERLDVELRVAHDAMIAAQAHYARCYEAKMAHVQGR